MVIFSEEKKEEDRKNIKNALLIMALIFIAIFTSLIYSFNNIKNNLTFLGSIFLILFFIFLSHLMIYLFTIKKIKYDMDEARILNDPNSFYSVRSYCPSCKHCDYTNYKKGYKPAGNDIVCSKCGAIYVHNNFN